MIAGSKRRISEEIAVHFLGLGAWRQIPFGGDRRHVLKVGGAADPEDDRCDLALGRGLEHHLVLASLLGRGGTAAELCGDRSSPRGLGVWRQISLRG